jgi:methyl-accepting chemotaxis protein
VGNNLLVCSLVIVFFLENKLTHPLIEIAKHSKQLGELDISKNVAENYWMQKDEIGTLSKAFQGLTVNLRKIITELSESAGLVSDTANPLTDTTQQSANASDDITRTIEEIAKGAYEQAKNTETGLLHASLLEEKMEKANQEIKLMLQSLSSIAQQAVATMEEQKPPCRLLLM